MTVLIPNKKVAARWNGALERRLRHAPLESFLIARGRKWAPVGEASVTDNIACATLYFMDQALIGCQAGGRDPSEADHHAAIGRAACAVSHGLATLIQETGSWRIAALIATARILASRIGPDAAARQSATSARDFAKALKTGLDGELLRLGSTVAAAVQGSQPALCASAAALISHHLAPPPAVQPARRAAPAP